jgi:hypothetical protein
LRAPLAGLAPGSSSNLLGPVTGILSLQPTSHANATFVSPGRWLRPHLGIPDTFTGPFTSRFASMSVTQAHAR